jgi:hypothetical protein
MTPNSRPQTSEWAPILGVVLAGAISTANTSGYWDPLNSGMGLLLIASLHYFQQSDSPMKRSLLFAAAYGFCLVMVQGIFYDAVLSLLGLQDRALFYVINVGDNIGTWRFCAPFSQTCMVQESFVENTDFVINWREIGMLLLWLILALLVWLVQSLAREAPPRPATSAAPGAD